MKIINTSNNTKTYISSELILIKDIPLGNGYPKNMISQIIEKSQKKVTGTYKIRRKWIKSKTKIHNFVLYPMVVTEIKEKIKKNII